MPAQTKPVVLPAPSARTHDEPRAVDAELALLHSLLNGRDIGAAMLEDLRPEHFYFAMHGWLYAAMLELHARDMVVDVLTVAERLRERNELDHLTFADADGVTQHGAAALDTLRTREVTSTGAVRSYAKLIIDKYTRRIMQRHAQELATASLDEQTDASILIDRHVRSLEHARPFDLNREFVTGTDSAERHATLIKAQAARQTWHAAPWRAMSERVPVVNDGEIISVMAPEGSGKSIICANWAQIEALAGHRAVLIHTEMTQKQVLDRRAASASPMVAYSQLRKPDKMTDADWLALGDATNTIKSWMKNLDYWHAGNIGENNLFTVMQRMVDDFGIRTIILDGLNDVEPERERGENDAAAWRRLLARLEAFVERNLVLMILSVQLNAEGNAYQIGRALRQKSTLILKMEPQRLDTELTWDYDGVKYMYTPTDNHPIVSVTVEKNRNGARGTFELLLVGPRYLIVDPPQDFGANTRKVNAADEAGYHAAGAVRGVGV